MNITYSAVRNPKYIHPANTHIECEVDFDHLDEDWTVFTAVASGDLPHSHDIFAECVAGDYGTVEAFSAPANIDNTALTQAEIDAGAMTAMDLLREERDRLLRETDWWANSDRTMTSEQTTYRQALRDLPANSANCQLSFGTSNTAFGHIPENHDLWVNVTWPTKP